MPGEMQAADGVPGSVPLDAEEVQRLRYSRPELFRDPATAPAAAPHETLHTLPPLASATPARSAAQSPTAVEPASAPRSPADGVWEKQTAGKPPGEDTDAQAVEVERTAAGTRSFLDRTQSVGVPDDILFAKRPLARTASSASDASSIAEQNVHDAKEHDAMWATRVNREPEQQDVTTPKEPTRSPSQKRLSLRSAANAIRAGIVFGSQPQSPTPAKKFQPTKALQRAAHRLTVARVFNGHLLVSVCAHARARSLTLVSPSLAPRYPRMRPCQTAGMTWCACVNRRP